jgi:chemotaxis protein methyltransferase CheR
MNNSITVTEEEVASLAQSILIRYGIDFTCYEPNSLKRRIIRLLHVCNLNSIHELWLRILRERTFINEFINEISVGMTSMFRDPVFWKHLKQTLIRHTGESSRLSIWHAGCSTGEEVYSLGILLDEVGLLSRTSALATDISQNALEDARKGVYHKIKMIENEKNFKEYNAFAPFAKHYQPIDGKHVKMHERLVQHVSFQSHNLISDTFNGKYDVILCRNVMIYFDTAAKKKLLRKFYDSLSPGGYFIIGFYDTMLPLIEEKLFSLVDSEAKIFQKII